MLKGSCSLPGGMGAHVRFNIAAALMHRTTSRICRCPAPDPAEKKQR